jgi:hypothetical protein
MLVVTLLTPCCMSDHYVRFNYECAHMFNWYHYLEHVVCQMTMPDLKGNFGIFYTLAKYIPGDIKYIFAKFYRHISTNNEANRKFVI